MEKVEEVWMNGTKKIVFRNKQGGYLIYLNEKYIEWLNEIHKEMDINRHNLLIYQIKPLK